MGVFQALQLKERTNGTIALLGWNFVSGPTAINNQWGNSPPAYPRTFVAAYSSDLTQVVEYRESNVATAEGTPDYCRTVYGCSPVNDRFIGAPGPYAISSMNLERSFAQYPTLQNYQATGNQNTFAKFSSATTSLPINTSAATPRNILTPTWTPTNMATTSYDYAPSIVVTDNTTQSWSYFSS